MVVDTDFALWIVFIDIVLECGETQHVAILMVAIILRMLLHCIVRQVNEGVVDVLQVYAELGTRCAQVPFSEEV